MKLFPGMGTAAPSPDVYLRSNVSFGVAAEQFAKALRDMQAAFAKSISISEFEYLLNPHDIDPPKKESK